MAIVLDVLIVLVKISAIVAGLTHLLLLYELRNTIGLERWRRLCGQHPVWSLLKGMLQGFASQLLVMTTYVLGWFPRLWYPPCPPMPSAPAVLLVHGLYHNASAWSIFKLRLKRAGFKNVYAFSYSSWSTEFHSIANSLEKRINQVLSDCPEQRLLLLGHSLGGLLIRHYMATGVRRDEIMAAVTLGAPHQGSRLAALGLGRLSRSLIFHGDLVERLRHEDAAPLAPCLSLYSPSDEFVTPLAGLRIELPGWEERMTPPISHVGMLYHPWVARETIRYFRERIRDEWF